VRTIHLFAGIGGGLLADVILGHSPILAVEINPYCCQVLRERVEDGWFPGMHVHEGDIREFDFTPWWGRVDQISAGFPCQDISAAGRGIGIAGERSGLVSEVWRAIDAIRPAFVFLENSPLIRTRGRDVVWRELQRRGYVVVDGTIAASDVGALHIRKRWWCLAADPDGLRQLQSKRDVQAQWGRVGDCSQNFTDVDVLGRDRRTWDESKPERWKEFEDVSADTLRDRLQISVQQGWLSETDGKAIQAASGYCGEYGWNPTNSDVCGVVYGISPKMESVKGLGNAQVPLQAALAWVLLYRKLITKEIKNDEL
jgi:DNA (cytosine-5)-methyltransferase 1